MLIKPIGSVCSVLTVLLFIEQVNLPKSATTYLKSSPVLDASQTYVVLRITNMTMSMRQTLKKMR